MRSVFAISLLLFVALPAAAPAQTAGTNSTPVAAQEPENRLGKLFAELKRAGSEPAAQRIADRIRREWARSGSASIDLLMQWAQKAIDEEKNDVAMDFLDSVVVLAPTYAEGWNRRATLHFAMDDHAKAMADIGRTLQLEPRHFGALGGMAAILRQSGRKEAAMHAYQRLLDVYPMLRRAQTELGELADEMAGQRI